MLRGPPYLRATKAYVIKRARLLIAQLTGINGIIYYSPCLYEAIGYSGYFALLGARPAHRAACIPGAVLVNRCFLSYDSDAGRN